MKVEFCNFRGGVYPTKEISMSKFFLLLILPMTLLISQCSSPGVDNRLSRVEAKQDSLLKVLTTMQEKNEFMAMRMGWKPPADTTPKVIPLGASYFQGAENASLTIVEFSDLQCPYCAQSAPILDSLVRTYPNQVKVIFKHFPLSFHPQARAAAAAAIAAGKQGKFYPFRYKVAPHFRSLNDSLFLSIAKELNLDMAQFKKEMALTPEVNALLDDDMNLGREIGVEGTPTLFVNGRLASDRSFEYLASLVPSK
jgi:protein-disulfide isomerase